MLTVQGGNQRHALSLPDVSLGLRHSFWTSLNLTWALSAPSCLGEVLEPRSHHQDLPWCPVEKLPFLPSGANKLLLISAVCSDSFPAHSLPLLRQDWSTPALPACSEVLRRGFLQGSACWGYHSSVPGLWLPQIHCPEPLARLAWPELGVQPLEAMQGRKH